MRKNEETLTLQCELTDDERLEYSKELAEELTKQSETEGALKSMAQQMKGQIQEHEARIGVLVNMVNIGREFRPVKCDIVYDWDGDRKIYYRQDTGIECRKDLISGNERQEYLLDQKRIEEEDALVDEQHEPELDAPPADNQPKDDPADAEVAPDCQQA